MNLEVENNEAHKLNMRHLTLPGKLSSFSKFAPSGLFLISEIQVQEDSNFVLFHMHYLTKQTGQSGVLTQFEVTCKRGHFLEVTMPFLIRIKSHYKWNYRSTERVREVIELQQKKRCLY